MRSTARLSSRRSFLRASVAGAVSFGAISSPRPLAAAPAGRAGPRAVVRSRSTVSYEPGLYHGWPTLARRRDGELLLVASGGREAHVCPFGRVELQRSRDDGATWSYPQVVMDGPIDDRDAGVVETARGTLLVTTFTSLAYAPILARAETLAASGGDGAWDAERLRRWRGAHGRVDERGRQAALGVWMARSTDGGITFSGRFDSLVNSPHGPIQLADGRLLYAGKDLWRDGERVGVCESVDDGASWRWLATIAVRDGDDHREYHELHAVETADGRIVVHIRNHNTANSGETLQCDSADGGKTWSKPRAIGVWGLPSHLLRLRDGRLLMSYGHRRAPFGNQVRVSDDHGRSWSAPLAISDDGAGGDLGYPATVELADGSLLSAWYETLAGSPRAVLRQARWTIE